MNPAPHLRCKVEIWRSLKQSLLTNLPCRRRYLTFDLNEQPASLLSCKIKYGCFFFSRDFQFNHKIWNVKTGWLDELLLFHGYQI